MHLAFRGKDVYVSYSYNSDASISGTGYITRAYDGFEPDAVPKETLDKIELVNWILERGIEKANRYIEDSSGFESIGRYREKEFFESIISQEKSSLCAAIKCYLNEDDNDPPNFSLKIFADDKLFEQLCQRFTDVLRSNFVEYHVRLDFIVASREKAPAPHWSEICGHARAYTTEVEISFQKRFNVEDENFFREKVKKDRW